MNIKVMKTTFVFLILAVTTNTAVIASTARCSQTTRSKINSVSNKASSRTVGENNKSNLRTLSYSSTHHTKKLLTPDEVIIITSPTSMTFNGIRTGSIQISKISSNNLSDIFIPPKKIA